MDALILGGLTALSAAFGLAFWTSLVRPALLDALAGADDLEGSAFFAARPGSLTALRFALGAGLALAAFLTGAATAFLGVTR